MSHFSSLLHVKHSSPVISTDGWSIRIAGDRMSVLSFIRNLFKGSEPMPAVDFSGLDADIQALANLIKKVGDQISASGADSSAQIAKLQTDLAAEQAAHAADIATAQAAEAQMEAALKAQIDALTALLPAQAPAPIETPAAA